MQADLGIDPVGWGWVTAIFTLSYCLFEIPTGALGDRIGPRRVLTRVVLWWSAFTSLTGAVSNYYLLLLTRFLFGAGEAGAFPNASIVVSRWYPASKRASMAGVLLMASQVGGAIAPLLIVPIQMRYGWRASFFLFGAVGVVWATVWFWWFRDSPAEKPGVSQAELDSVKAVVPNPHGFAWRLAFRSRDGAGDGGNGLLLRLRLHLLPDVVSHLPDQGTRILRGRPASVSVAVRGRGVREPCGWRRK